MMGILSRLTARNFRNLTDLDMELSPGFNLLTGDNGEGKSNILEAVCYLALLRSFRTHSVSDLVHWEHDTFALKGRVEDVDAACSFDVSIIQGQKRVLRLNGHPVARASDFINRFICVPLVPEDIDLVKGSASGRRRFLDIALSQHDGGYLVDLQKYREALRSRNALLRAKRRGDGRVLKVYEELLIRHGSRVESLRRCYVGRFNEALAPLSAHLLGSSRGPYTVRYQCAGIGRDTETRSPEKLAELLSEALDRSRERDVRDGHTTVGPHRGDVVIELGGKRLSDFGSEGECRMGSLALRLTSLRQISGNAADGRAVVVLVDDVIGELDDTRRQRFMDALQGADQVILSATDMPRALESAEMRHYRVANGRLERA